jgi:hypothetical protein
MVNISTTVRGHYGNDVYLWAIIIRRFCDTTPRSFFVFNTMAMGAPVLSSGAQPMKKMERQGLEE